MPSISQNKDQTLESRNQPVSLKADAAILWNPFDIVTQQALLPKNCKELNLNEI